MANTWYPSGANSLIKGDIHIKSSGDTIKVTLVTNSYTYDSTDVYRSDITVGVISNGTATLTLSDPTDGKVQAANPSFSSITTSTVVNAIIVWKDTGVESTSPLLMYIDSSANLPFTTTGATVKIAWSSISNLFRL